MSNLSLRLGAFCLALFTAGCGLGGSSVQYNDKVEGTITLDNQPLGGVLVLFVPEEEEGARRIPGSSGLTDDAGHFSLKCDDGHDGAVIGKHRIVLTRGPAANTDRDNDPNNKRRKDPGPVVSSDKRPVPAIYGIANKPRLFQNVTADQHGYDMSIKSGDK
jgi:hypothetical protein